MGGCLVAKIIAQTERQAKLSQGSIDRVRTLERIV